MRAAFSNVDGFPAATHIGGCGDEYGFGSTLRAGIEKNCPSKPGYSPACHILRNSPTTSSNMAAGEVGVGDAEALLLGGRRTSTHAELEAPFRQVIEHRHALGDARRMVDRRRDVEDARTEVDARGRGREVAEEHLVGGEVRVLGEEVVLGRPRVLEADALGGLHDRDFVEDAAVLVAPELREHARAVEQSELHEPLP